MQTETSHTDRLNINPFDVLVMLLIIISFFSLILLSFEAFSVDIALILGGISFLAIAVLSRNSYVLCWNLSPNKHLLAVVVLILIALIFRYEPYLYVIGGQDEGVYVNMSRFFETRGTVFQTNELREKINDKAVLEIYDKENLQFYNKVPGKYEGGYLPGVYITNSENAQTVFQFYHLHPLWMAIAGSLFGEQNRVYSLVFFSLISLIAFYLLAYEYSHSRFIAFIAGLLLAINPLHAFFSKFPVTEVMALAFNSLCFYYLLRFYYKAKKNQYHAIYLVLSSFSIAGLFFTRISGFLYLPFFFMFLILTSLYVSDDRTRKYLSFYVLSVFCLYGLSVLYGLAYSYPYSFDIYNMSFAKVFGNEWEMGLFYSIALSGIIYLLVCVSAGSRINKAIKTVNTWLLQALPYLFIVIICLGLFKVYQLGFSNKYIGHYWMDEVFHMAGRGWLSVFYSSLMVTAEYLSPFLTILFFISLFKFKNKFIEQNIMLLIFLSGFCVYIALFQWTIPYQYYYARYLLSEVVPYVMLFTIVNSLPDGKTASGSKIPFYMLIAAGLYFLFFSAFQFQGKETDGAYESLKEISDISRSDSVILLDKRNFSYTANELKTALIYFFDKQVFSFSTDQQLDIIRMSDDFKNQYHAVYILSHEPCKADLYTHEYPLIYKQGNFAKSVIIPRTFSYLDMPVYFCKLKK